MPKSTTSTSYDSKLYTLYTGWRTTGSVRQWRWPWKKNTLEGWYDYFMAPERCRSSSSWPLMMWENYQQENRFVRWLKRWFGDYDTLALLIEYMVKKVVVVSTNDHVNGKQTMLRSSQESKSVDDVDVLERFVQDVDTQFKSIQQRNLTIDQKKQQLAIACYDISQRMAQIVREARPSWWRRHFWKRSSAYRNYSQLKCKQKELLETIESTQSKLCRSFTQSSVRPLTLASCERFKEADKLTEQLTLDIQQFESWKKDCWKDSSRITSAWEFKKWLSEFLSVGKSYIKGLWLRYHPDKNLGDTLKEAADAAFKKVTALGELFEIEIKEKQGSENPRRVETSQSNDVTVAEYSEYKKHVRSQLNDLERMRKHDERELNQKIKSLREDMKDDRRKIEELKETRERDQETLNERFTKMEQSLRSREFFTLPTSPDKQSSPNDKIPQKEGVHSTVSPK